MRFFCCLALMLAVANLPAAKAQTSDVFQAVRRGDIGSLKARVSKEELAARDRRGATPLMHAAAFGTAEMVKILLHAGADVNARNDSDATALLWAARQPEKARLLIQAGADVNARSKQGRTPLMVASLRRGNVPTVALLLEKGADVHAKGNRPGFTALRLAAGAGDAEIMRLLIEKGADPDAKDIGGGTPLFAAASSGNADAVRLLLAKHVDVHAAGSFAPPQRNGPMGFRMLTALHGAAGTGSAEMVRDLLQAGAKVDARDARGLTPLFFAVATEYPSIDLILALIKAGADVNAKDLVGETPLDWAEKFGYPSVLTALRKAGAKRGLPSERPKLVQSERPRPMQALARSLPLLQASSAQFFKRSGCVGCHHQPMIARAQAVARAAGIPLDEDAAKEQLLQMRAQWVSLQEEFLQTLNPGGGANRLSENLLGLKAASYPADTITDSAVVDLADSQEPEGNWLAGETQPRPPIAESEFAATTRAIQALRAYMIPAREQEFAQRIARARAWLLRAEPITTEDFTMRLWGLASSGASGADVKSATKALLRLQRPDGGWAANEHLTSDAYATAGALVALIDSKGLRSTDAPYKRGVDYLLSTQYPDGSWYVRSRAIKFQPYFESDFPFGHDQWISTAATAWAVQAIGLGLEAPAASPAAR
ncbi:MAG TPA: ankyrin repeat domain-containing protein [Bryobacteraceae bacterium]|nr:ankyrin repeat domain-containing protein [Bryobacteraceae bacterium]